MDLPDDRPGGGAPQPEAVLPWHARATDDVLAALGATRAGLSAAEAQARLARAGRNRLTAAPSRGAAARLAAQFANLLILVLIGAAVIAAIVGDLKDAAVILLVVIANAAIGYVQEGRAERALAAISAMLSPGATVLRDGHRRAIAAEEIVPGDIVVLEPGDRVPADLRLIETRALAIEEAALTGESVAATKQPEPAAPDAPLGDRHSAAFAGTIVAAGAGLGVVTATGDETEVGRIGRAMRETVSPVSPLVRRMSEFSRRLTVMMLAIGILAFAWGVLVIGIPGAEMAFAAVALFVAAIPEGLPTILTVTLAIGVQRMAARRAIVRRMPAVEALGSVDTICTDKTGTLTANVMTVRAIMAQEGRFGVTGEGYAPRGAVEDEAGADVSFALPGGVVLLARASALCNDADIVDDAGGWTVAGDPMEGALLAFAVKAGAATAREAWPRRDAIPFDPAQRVMATLHHDAGGAALMVLKGAPEAVLARCADVPADAVAEVARLGAEGMRVIAFAERSLPHRTAVLEAEDAASGLTFLGLCGLIDPPRQEAAEAVAAMRAAGITVKMITGDHPGTATAIARAVGIAEAPRAIEGAAFEAIAVADRPAAAAAHDVFARVSPLGKLALVDALQARGHTVAMTGDGVNDAVALKRADIGVAMGRGGTEAARQAASIVLADDNFATIAAAVREGRHIYDNLRKAILFLLPVNGGECLAVLASIIFGTTMPITPLQILWVNMVSSAILAMGLAFEPEEPDLMQRPPRPRNAALLDRFLFWRVVLVSVLFLAGINIAFHGMLAAGAELEAARTAAVCALVAMETWYLFSVRFLRATSLTLARAFGTRAVWASLIGVFASQALFVWAPPLHVLFDTRALGPWPLLLAAGLGAAVFLILEAEKALLRRRG
ncbi:HAD-IC family P-type ATPase [Elioraea sp.]|uniref:cation-translocating P-type ATPase n=1 Tax=Elioraea sp. TaxID=2185103 RepID=UPI0025C490A4|nr:HAD-IC family P-type ATPase [Elioraea sp.]